MTTYKIPQSEQQSESEAVLKVAIRDGTFHENSMTLSGENAGKHPVSFHWDREGRGDLDVLFSTDMHIKDAAEDFSRHVALLIEPLAVSRTHYDMAVAMQHQFDLILTYEMEYLKRGLPWSPYFFGGSWISDWDIYPKDKLVSIITSDKWATDGHRLRHQIVRQFLNRLELYVFGEPYNPRFDFKWEPLRNYCYSIVVENTKCDFWFTEKLIDAFSQGTVPIYWGCPSIHKFFDQRGILAFESLDELDSILRDLSFQDWQSRTEAIQRNFELAKNYCCAEDNIFKMYPGVFSEDKPD